MGLGQAHSLPRHCPAPLHPRHLLWKTQEKEEEGGTSPILSEGVPVTVRNEGWGILALLSPLSRVEGVCGCRSLKALSEHPKFLEKMLLMKGEAGGL